MRCPKCGNEVGPEEAFCGQCGTPMMPAAQLTEMVQTTPSYNGLPGKYTRHLPSSSNSYNTGMQPSPNGYNTGMLPPPGGSLPPNQSTTRPLGPQEQTNFYQDSTEAMTSLPGQPRQPGQPVQHYLPAQYPQQPFASTPVQGRYSETGQFGPQQQPFQQGGYAPPGYTPSQPSPTGQGYGIPPKLTPPPQKQQNNTLLIVACIFLAIALLSVISFGVLYLTRDHSSPGTSTTITSTATTATPLPSPTPSPSLSPSPNASSAPTDTPTPIPSPSPTTIPTPTPDANFSWCQSCSSLGFSVEYPNGWAQGTTSDEPGVQFQNQLNPQEYAAFKTPNNVTNNTTATDLANTDLQNNFEKQPGYTSPSSQSTATIGGENWVTETASYRPSNGQKIRVEVFATIHQGKAYIIELQAVEGQFASENEKYFQVMLSRFQFE